MELLLVMKKIVLYGVVVYTSDELKDKLRDIIQREGKQDLKNTLLRLIDEDVIVPVINEPGKIRQLIMKLRKIQPLRIYGMASCKENKVYIIFRDMKPTIIEVITHEAVHLANCHNPEKFTSINRSIYEKFYSVYFKEIFKTDKLNMEALNFYIDKISKRKIHRQLYYDVFLEIAEYSSLEEERIDKITKTIGNAVGKRLSGDRKALLPYRKLIHMPLGKAYRVLFKNVDYHAGLGQELWSPSEIISILSTINPDHPNVVKSLKLIKTNQPILKSKMVKMIN